MAECATFPGLDLGRLREAVRDAHDVLEFASRIRPISAGLDVPRPTQREVDQAVDRALGDLKRILRQSGRRQPTRTELEDLRFDLRRDVKGLFESADIDGAAIVRSLGNLPILSGLAGKDFTLALDGQLAASMVSMTEDGEEAAKLILIIDLILEVVGLILGIIGLSLPRPNASKLTDTFLGFWKKEGFRNAVKKLLMALKVRDAAAILNALNALRSLGVLGEILAAWFADLGWLDYAIAIARFLAWLLVAVGTGGSSAVLKLVTALISIAEILGKVEKIDKLV